MADLPRFVPTIFLSMAYIRNLCKPKKLQLTVNSVVFDKDKPKSVFSQSALFWPVSDLWAERILEVSYHCMNIGLLYHIFFCKFSTEFNGIFGLTQYVYFLK